MNESRLALITSRKCRNYRDFLQALRDSGPSYICHDTAALRKAGFHKGYCNRLNRTVSYILRDTGCRTLFGYLEYLFCTGVIGNAPYEHQIEARKEFLEILIAMPEHKLPSETPPQIIKKHLAAARSKAIRK